MVVMQAMGANGGATTMAVMTTRTMAVMSTRTMVVMGAVLGANDIGTKTTTTRTTDARFVALELAVQTEGRAATHGPPLGDQANLDARADSTTMAESARASEKSVVVFVEFVARALVVLLELVARALLFFVEFVARILELGAAVLAGLGVLGLVARAQIIFVLIGFAGLRLLVHPGPKLIQIPAPVVPDGV